MPSVTPWPEVFLNPAWPCGSKGSAWPCAVVRIDCRRGLPRRVLSHLVRKSCLRLKRSIHPKPCGVTVYRAMDNEIGYNDIDSRRVVRIFWMAAIMQNKVKKKSITKVLEGTVYPPEAFEFVREGLALTVQRVHRDVEKLSEGQRHVTGSDLARGLRDLAVRNYGVLAPVVLAHWNIHSTMDFGKIVFAMVENGLMHKTPEDNIEDFRDVYDFAEAFTAPRRPQLPGKPVFDLKSR